MRVLDFGFQVHLPGEMTSSNKWGGRGFQRGHLFGLEGKEPGRRKNRGIRKNFREFSGKN